MIFFISCKQSKTPEQKVVDSAFEHYSKNPSDSTAGNFISAVETYVNTVGPTDSVAGIYLLKAAKASAGIKKSDKAAELYKQYLLAHPGKPDEKQQLADVITLLEATKSQKVKNAMYTAYAERFPNEPISDKYKQLIQQPAISSDSLLSAMKVNTFDEETFRIKIDDAKEYVDATEMVALIQPQTKTIDDHLYRAAETARTLRQPRKAIQLYEWIVEKYPSSVHTPVAFFLTGFITDNDLEDFEKAGKIYTEFLTRYPNNEYAESAKFLIKILGKSDTELSKILEDKSGNKENN